MNFTYKCDAWADRAQTELNELHEAPEKYKKSDPPSSDDTGFIFQEIIYHLYECSNRLSRAIGKLHHAAKWFSDAGNEAAELTLLDFAANLDKPWVLATSGLEAELERRLKRAIEELKWIDEQYGHVKKGLISELEARPKEAES